MRPLSCEHIDSFPRKLSFSKPHFVPERRLLFHHTLAVLLNPILLSLRQSHLGYQLRCLEDYIHYPQSICIFGGMVLMRVLGHLLNYVVLARITRTFVAQS